MKIQDLFVRDIKRAINGVVKADQLDASSVWQELDEFVVTRELARHFSDVVATLLASIESGGGAADTNGIWVSGFFGSGKSHFIKVLSYLLENAEHQHDGKRRRAVDFFANKFGDAMLFADLKRAVAADTETILFNVDSKADHRAGRDTLLQVFVKVLNEKQGYSGEHPHIAHLERHLAEIGKLEVFHHAYQQASGGLWLEERDGWGFRRDQVRAALKEATGQSDASVDAWVEGAEEHYGVSIESFAKSVKRYLDAPGRSRRLMFLVDEVGQFIGSDTHLMLNLQTITEALGTVCRGRAWVVVTSQEDLDAVLGDLKNSKQNDFSKIQGRFKTRLSLSSANVDEVIKKRLLDKKPEALKPLAAAYEGKHDILRNQLSFLNAGMSFKRYEDAADFATCYPFPAYQFRLVQKVFESIRKAGATGLHLSQGERSTLDAFQNAAKQVGIAGIGALVPFYSFYPSVEGFLDTAVKRTIELAKDNHALEAFDATVLQVLFLIRYIDELPGSVDNLVTLCIDEIDSDKLALRRRIQASLNRLESETLIERKGELYFFLTNEERDIGREIKQTQVPSGEEERELGRLLFEEILADIRKHTYSATGRDFSFTRLCDDHPVGHRIEGSLEVAFVSPLGDSYAEFISNERCVLHTSHEQQRVLIRLPDDPELGRELRTYLQTERYVKAKHTNTLPDTTKRILQARSQGNRDRRLRLVASLKSQLADAAYFASGRKIELKRSEPKEALGDALEYVIQNAYPKMSFITRFQDNPKHEIQSTLRANDVEQVTLALAGAEANAQALEDLREYIRLCSLTSKQIVLFELIEKRYGPRPYGWPELEVVLLVARLAVLKEINLFVNAAPLPLDQAYDHLTSPNKQRKVIITQRQVPDGELIEKSQTLGKDLFAAVGPAGEDDLFTWLKQRLTAWHTDLASFEPLAKTGKYPGRADIERCLAALRKFVEEPDSMRFLQRFTENKSELLDLAEEIQDLNGFYKNQKHSWEQLRDAVAKFSQNQLQLNADTQAAKALARMLEILKLERPYAALREVAALAQTVNQVNEQLVADVRRPAMAEIQGLLDGVTEHLVQVSASDAFSKSTRQELTQLLNTAAGATSIAHIAEARQLAEPAFDRALSAIEAAQARPNPTVTPEPATGQTEVANVTPAAPLRRRRVVETKKLWPSSFLETQQDVDTFLRDLRSELEAAIAANERIQIK